MPHFRAPGSSVIAEVKRRSPSKGDLADDPRPRRAGRRRTPPAEPPRSACSPRSAASAAASPTCAPCALPSTTPLLRKDFMVTDVPAAGGTRGRRRPGAADRGRARRRPAAPPARPCPRARPDGARRGARRGRGRARRGPRRRADRRQRPQPEDPRGRPGRLRAGWPRSCPTTASWSPSRAISGPDDVARYAELGARVVLVGEALVRGRRPARRRRRDDRTHRPASTRMTTTEQPPPRSPRRCPSGRRPGTPTSRAGSGARDRLGRPVHARGAGRRARRARPTPGSDAMADPAFVGEFDDDPARVRRPAEPALRRRSGSPSRSAAGCCSSARTSTTPAPTRSATCSARRC